MKDGSCVILRTVHDMIPTFEKIETKVLPEWKIIADVYKGDVANRGKGTLIIKNPVQYNPHIRQQSSGGALRTYMTVIQ